MSDQRYHIRYKNYREEARELAEDAAVWFAAIILNEWDMPDYIFDILEEGANLDRVAYENMLEEILGPHH